MTVMAEAIHEQVHMRWGVRIPLSDGVHLGAALYLPRAQVEPQPAILTLTPYTAQTYHDRGMYFAAHGYPFLIVDVRGRGNSEGLFRPFIHEDADAVEVVEWLAKQSFCNGKVSMWGGSYGGCVQWGAARHRPKALASIVPVASVHSCVDYPLRGNIPTPYWVRWLNLVSGHTSQSAIFYNNERYWAAGYRQWFESGAPFEQVDTQLGMPSATFQEWVKHPLSDEYWRSYNPTPEQLAQISIPILTITGAYDSAQLGAIEYYRQHTKHCTSEGRERHYLIIGPWDHSGTRTPIAKFGGLSAGPASLVDLPRLHLDWYEWTLRGGPRPDFLRKKVAYYIMVADRWRYADSLESITSQLEALYLHSNSNPTDVFHSGRLSSDAPRGSAPDTYVYDPRDIGLARLESTIDSEDWADQQMVYALSGKHLVYHSAPFERDIEVSGFFQFSAWLSIDQLDTDFRVCIYDVALNGSTVQLTCESLRARYREGLHEAKLIRTQEPLRYDFERFTFVARRICRGHRLRLVVGPVNSIYSQKNYNSGGAVASESIRDARTVTVRLFHDPAHPSVLRMPIGQPDDLIERSCSRA